MKHYTRIARARVRFIRYPSVFEFSTQQQILTVQIIRYRCIEFSFVSSDGRAFDISTERLRSHSIWRDREKVHTALLELDLCDMTVFT